jgi:hypothetical protein
MTFISMLADRLTEPPRIGIVGHTRTSGLDLLRSLETALGDHVHQAYRTRGSERLTLTNGTTVLLLTRGTQLRSRSLDLIVTDYTPELAELAHMRLNVMTRQGSIRHLDGTLLAT